MLLSLLLLVGLGSVPASGLGCAGAPFASDPPVADRDGPGDAPANGGASSEDESATDEEGSAEPADGPSGARDEPRRTVLKTVYDDERVGEDQAALVAAELGLVEDERLQQYLRSVAVRLLRHTVDRPFDYAFGIVDQTAPNAFALPGGKIYVSRGLLALVGSEDELAAVLGHEITHAAERHAAGRIEHARRLNPFSIGLQRAAAIAAYGRAQERDADRGGQILAAKAGYDPGAIATFLRKLDAWDRYEIGWSRMPSFLATHPTSPERAALATNRATTLDWSPVPPVAADTPHGYLGMVEGLVLGDDPAAGVFQDTLFVHPDLGFSIRFPRGWETRNDTQAVSATSPERDAQASLTVAGEAGDLEGLVDAFLAEDGEGADLRLRDRRTLRLGDLPALRIEGTASDRGGRLWVQMTFVEHRDLVYRLAFVTRGDVSSQYRGRSSAFAQSFRSLTEAETRGLQVVRLRIARALAGETLQQLSERTRNALDLVYTGVLNDLFASTTLEKGAEVKIGLAEPYIPKPPGPDEADGPPTEGDGDAPAPVLDEEEDAPAPPAFGRSGSTTRPSG